MKTNEIQQLLTVTNERPENFMILTSPADAVVEETFKGSLLNPYPAGLYLRGQAEAFMVPNKQYFVRLDGVQVEIASVDLSKRLVHISNAPSVPFDALLEQVWDADGNMVCRHFRKIWLNGAISSGPTIPVFGREVIKAVVLDMIDRAQIFNKTPYSQANLRDVYTKWFKNSMMLPFEAFEEALRTILWDIRYQVKTSVGTQTWEFIKLRELSDGLLITFCGDFRIHDWNLKMAETFFES